MRGLIYFDDEANLLERLFKVDLTQRPPKDSLRAFTVLEELIRRFPESQYVADARQRMVYLRNRLAAYENHVARYYIKRGAYIAAAQRAQFAVENYPGAPELEQSLQLLVTAYERVGMRDLAADARRVLRENYGVESSSTAQL
jgi:outer membrane protein assembly factor BamD